MAAISEGNKMITSKIEDLNSTLKTLQQKTALIEKKQDDFEGGLNRIDNDVDNLARRLSQAEHMVSDLKLKVDDMENRSRRCNLRLTGLPEGWEEKRKKFLREKKVDFVLSGLFGDYITFVPDSGISLGCAAGGNVTASCRFAHLFLPLYVESEGFWTCFDNG
ncbi:unnamed protein product [Boreogadus saida]